jgi:hypothetical protein
VDEKIWNGEAKWTGWMKRLERGIGVGRMDNTYERRLDGLY